MAEGPPRPGVTTPTTRTAKIVIIGSASTGKTSLRNRYAKGHFSQAYIATIGADFVTKKVELQDGSTVALQLWDTAGQERFQALGAAFYRGADACILVYALNSPDSLHKIKSWYTSFLERCPVPEGQEQSFPFVCVGNKSDLVQSHDYAVSEEGGGKNDGNEEGNKNVNLDEVKKLLEELCPPLEKESKVKKSAQPSAVPSGSDVKTAKIQQEHELRSDDPSSSSLSKSRTCSSSKSRKSKRNDPKRRSLDILPDRRDTTIASSVRNPSIYHTPSSSLAQSTSTWLNGSKVSSSSADTDDAVAEGSTSKGKKDKESFAGPDYTPDGIPVGPHGTEQAIEEEEEEYNSENEGDIHMNGHVPFHEDDLPNDEEEHDAISEDHDELPSKDIFGARDGIKHFTASAKSGENIDEIFEYLVKRINARWKWQDELDDSEGTGIGGGANARIGNVRKGGPNDSIQVGKKLGNNEQKGWRAACC